MTIGDASGDGLDSGLQADPFGRNTGCEELFIIKVRRNRRRIQTATTKLQYADRYLAREQMIITTNHGTTIDYTIV